MSQIRRLLSATALGIATLTGGVAGSSILINSAHAATEIPKGPLVSTEWLSQNLDNPKVRVIEVSVNPGVYERAHIPGAVNFSWHTDLNDKVKRDIVNKATDFATHDPEPDPSELYTEILLPAH